MALFRLGFLKEFLYTFPIFICMPYSWLIFSFFPFLSTLHLATLSTTTRPIQRRWYRDEYENGALVKLKLIGGTRNARREFAQVLLLLPHISHGLHWK